MRTLEARVTDLRPERETLLWAAVVLNAELLVVLAYVALAGPAFRTLSPLKVVAFYLYPWIWLDVALLAVVRTRTPPASTRRRLGAAAVAAGYFLVLAYAGGLVGRSGPAAPTGLRIALASLPPGWSPALLYSGPLLTVALLPFKLLGYLALGYLVYVTVLDAAGSVVGGVLGLFSCVSCTLPVIAGVLSGVVGGSTALVTAAYAQSYALSTVVFVLTVALLAWRPSFETVRQLRQAL
ncbi:MAG: hypothetical protein ABEJ23_10285 [Haloarculaceae archaeon]